LCLLARRNGGPRIELPVDATHLHRCIASYRRDRAGGLEQPLAALGTNVTVFQLPL
jgi:hypothetical protein